MISETLRPELAPFGVKVLTIMTGAVKTNTLAEGKNFKLPPSSLYSSIEKVIAARAMGEDGVPRTDASAYAEQVVSEVLGGADGRIWKGSFASVNRFLSSWVPSLLVGIHLTVL